MKRIRRHTLQSIAGSAGLSLLSVTDLTPLLEAVKLLNNWQSKGMAGAMSYMNRPAELLAFPQSLFPQGKTSVCFGIAYSAERSPPREPGQGRVARYAWGRDYHLVIPERLRNLIQLVEAEVGASVEHRIFTDATPLLERALAARAKLGFIGKNTMLIRPGQGSFLFLAEILWDVEVSDGVLGTIRGECGSCRRCNDECPTQAFAEPFVLDARKCISYLSIEKRGALHPEERRALGEWIFGCDVCQEVCPFNHASMKASAQPSEVEFRRASGVGPFLNLSEVLSIRSNVEYRRRFSGTALLRAKRTQMLRNAACVAANTAAESCMPELLGALSDSDAIVRQHTIWALGELRRKGALLPRNWNWDMLVERGRSDLSAEVREEAERLSER